MHWLCLVIVIGWWFFGKLWLVLAEWDVVMKTVCSGVSVGSCWIVFYGNGHVVSVQVKSMES